MKFARTKTGSRGQLSRSRCSDNTPIRHECIIPKSEQSRKMAVKDRCYHPIKTSVKEQEHRGLSYFQWVHDFGYNWIKYGSNLAKAAGSQVDGTACLTWSRSTICEFERATVYSVMHQPSTASDLVLAASFCQEPVNSNILLNRPDGIFPDKDNSRLNCSDICKMLHDLRKLAIFSPNIVNTAQTLFKAAWQLPWQLWKETHDRDGRLY